MPANRKPNIIKPEKRKSRTLTPLSEEQIARNRAELAKIIQSLSKTRDIGVGTIHRQHMNEEERREFLREQARILNGNPKAQA